MNHYVAICQSHRYCSHYVTFPELWVNPDAQDLDEDGLDD